MMQQRIIAILLTITICLSATAFTQADMSERLSLVSAREAIAESGGMVGKVFARGDNRYLVKRTDLLREKRPNVFEGEIEVMPLRKHPQ